MSCCLHPPVLLVSSIGLPPPWDFGSSQLHILQGCHSDDEDKYNPPKHDQTIDSDTQGNKEPPTMKTKLVKLVVLSSTMLGHVV